MHDFKRFPELTNSQMDFYYFESPHKQIFEDFKGTVVKVSDGDTIRIQTNFRDFDFPVRFFDNAAPELDEDGGPEAQAWLEGLILGEEVDVLVNPDLRVEKWGRLLGRIIFKGIDVGEESIFLGHSVPWRLRNDGVISVGS
jgi:endonuclease YncB( thermonuclease family)